MNRNLGEYVSNDGDASQVDRAIAVEAALQKFRHGENVGAQIEGHEHPAEDEENHAGEPFEVSDRQSRGRSRTGKPDEMLGGNIGHEQRCANCKPANIAAG